LKGEFVYYTPRQLKKSFLAARRKNLYELSLMPFVCFLAPLTVPAIIVLILLVLLARQHSVQLVVLPSRVRLYVTLYP
jgi:hypothetical protein